jgi:hypothetical protein
MTSERIIFEAGNTTRDIPQLISFKNFMGLHSLLYLLSVPCSGTLPASMITASLPSPPTHYRTFEVMAA